MTQVNNDFSQKNVNKKRIVVFIVTGILTIILAVLGIINLPVKQDGSKKYPFLTELNVTQTYNVKKNSSVYFQFEVEENKRYELVVVEGDIGTLTDENNKTIFAVTSSSGNGYVKKSYSLKKGVKYKIQIYTQSTIIKITIS